MKLSTHFFVILAAFGLVHASVHDGRSRMAARHHGVARNNGPEVVRRAAGRCKPSTTSSLVTSSTHASTQQASSSKASSSKASSTKASSTKQPEPTQNVGSSVSVVAHVDGLIRLTDSSCGSPRASKQISATDGPNGHIDWLNCGLEDGGWKPPFVTVNDIVAVDLEEAIKDPNSPFKPCKDYIPLFVKYANQHGVPPILIAAFAMQESSCNPGTVGGAGEQGLMQITKDKCGGVPDCKEPDFNIQTGTAYFANVLKDQGGSLLKAVGMYNGWEPGMTVASATAIQSKCCRCQNNMDYLVQFFDAWILNVNAYDKKIGKYFNLDSCPN